MHMNWNILSNRVCRDHQLAKISSYLDIWPMQLAVQLVRGCQSTVVYISIDTICNVRLILPA